MCINFSWSNYAFISSLPRFYLCCGQVTKQFGSCICRSVVIDLRLICTVCWLVGCLTSQHTHSDTSSYFKLHKIYHIAKTPLAWKSFQKKASLLDSAREIQPAKQMNGNQKWPSYCETYKMNFHRLWKGDDGIYFGYRFWFHCPMSKTAFSWKLFSGQWRFWNMISMIFVVLYDILHYCNLPYERSETESSRFENNVTSSHTSECQLAVRSATRRVDLEICFSQLYPNRNKLCCFRYQLL